MKKIFTSNYYYIYWKGASAFLSFFIWKPAKLIRVLGLPKDFLF